MEEHHVCRAAAPAGAIAANDGRSSGIRHGQPVLQAIVAGHGLGIAAEENVRSAARHIGGDRNRPLAARLRNNVRFALVLLGVEHLMGDAGFLQQIGEDLGFFDGDAPDQHGLALFVELADSVGV